MIEVPWWSPWVAVVALIASVAFNIWQAVDRRSKCKLDVVVEALAQLAWCSGRTAGGTGAAPGSCRRPKDGLV